MEFFLKFINPEAQQKINFSDKIIFLGSCFSDEISALAKQHGFNVIANPFGTLFHPLAIAQNILDSLADTVETNIIQNDDVYFDYSCSGKIFAMNEPELKDKVNGIRNHLKNEIMSSSYLFVTFGTAIGYHLNQTNQVVGNCHKQPARSFTKKLASIEQIVTIWKEVIQEIKRINPKINICFTVSPVRHVKEGLHENNLSKSTLLLAIDQLKNQDEINYFPSYELVIDILRDHRFFKEDLIHPNQQAIQFVWEKFMEVFLNSEIVEIAKKVKDIKNALQHRLQYPESKMALKFIDQLSERKSLLTNACSSICWE